MSAEWLRVLCRTEKLGRMSLFELWVAQIKLFLSWTSDILSFLSASKFPHQTFVTWWKNQTQAGQKSKKKRREKAGLVWICQRSGLKTINADGQTLMNAGDQIIQNACALKKTPTFPVSDWAAAFVLHSTSCRRKQKTHTGAKKKKNPALRFSARRAPGVYATDLAEISANKRL